MYEKLVNNLRGMSRYTAGTVTDLCKQAAEAIEELQQTVKHYKGCSDDWYKEVCDYKAICEQMKATIIVEAQHTEMFDERDKKTLMEMVKSLPLQIIPYGDEKPRWIPVTERLPECDLGAEVGNIEWISCGRVHAGCFGRGGKYRDAYFRTWTDAGEGMDAKDADYWRTVTLPEPPKEET